MTYIKTQRIYSCDQCGKVGAWDKNWSSYGSVLDLETIPNDVPVVCSDKCKIKFSKRLKNGSVQMPKVRCKGGYSVTVTGKRMGY